MRYLFAILVFLILISGISWKAVFPTAKEVKNPALVINDRIISQQEFERMRKEAHKFSNDDAEILDNIITKELLIQYAKSRGLDEEEAFKASIKNYYEQTLIKLLMERKYAAAKAEVSPEEVRRYREMCGKKVYFSVFPAASKDAYHGNLPAPSENRVERFVNLPEDIALAIYMLTKGEKSAPLKRNNGYVVYRLDRTEEITEGGLPPLTEKDIIATIRSHEIQQQIDDWVSSLRAEARIKVLVN